MLGRQNDGQANFSLSVVLCIYKCLKYAYLTNTFRVVVLPA